MGKSVLIPERKDLKEGKAKTVTSAFLSENAFWSLVFSAGEVYKKECFGILLGTISPGTGAIHLNCAIPYQAAERSYSWVAQGLAAYKRMQSILEEIPHLDFIGHFHSHSEGPLALSLSDRALCREDGFLMLIEIRKKKKSKIWKASSDGSFSGTIGDFYFRMASYVFDSGRARKVSLLCPSFQSFYQKRRRVSFG